jgi:LysR family transcriptional regulator, cys regulon transcriptional activator
MRLPYDAEIRVMKLQQVRYLCELVAHNYNASRTAITLHTSQPGVSRQIQSLERELGTVLLERNKTRIAGLTKAGKELYPLMRRLLNDAGSIKRQAQKLRSGKTRFIISTSHTYARHTLLFVLERFIAKHPDIAIQLRESAAPRIMQLLAEGEVDIGVATEPVDKLPGIALMPCYRVNHSLIMPQGHPLMKFKRPTLEQMLPYPIITYDERHYLGRVVREQFAKRGLEPNIVISIIDDDVMKAYVESGFGIAVLPSVAFNAVRDRRLRVTPATHLFGAGTCVVMTRDDVALQDHVRDFIALVKGTPVSGVSPAGTAAQQRVFYKTRPS